MNAEDFASLRKKAVALFDSQPAKDKLKNISLDAIFLALNSSAQPVKVRRISDDDAPDWFHDTIKKLKGSGEKFTVGRFLILAGKFPTSRELSLNTGRWLRSAGFIPRKTGGQHIFEIQ